MNTRKINITDATLMRKLGWDYEDIAKYFNCSVQGVRKAIGKVDKDFQIMKAYWISADLQSIHYTESLEDLI